MPLSSNFRKVVQISAGVILFFGFISAAVSVTVDQTFMSKPPGEWTEAEALQVLNESPWAHTITATVQDSQCGYDNPVFAGLYSEEQAQRFSSISPTPPSLAVRPDGAEYVVRLLSVKPIQAAAERLISLDEKWADYRSGYGFGPGSKPTNVNEEHYNPADEITIGIVLKHAGPDRASFRDYAFDEEKHAFPGGGLHHIWPCSGIKTAKGQVTA